MGDVVVSGDTVLSSRADITRPFDESFSVLAAYETIAEKNAGRCRGGRGTMHCPDERRNLVQLFLWQL